MSLAHLHVLTRFVPHSGCVACKHSLTQLPRSGTGEEILLSRDYHDIAHDSVVSWTIDSSHLPQGAFEDCPHVMIVLQHDVAKAEKKLLRGEVLTVVVNGC